MKQHEFWREQRRTEDAFEALDPDASDEVIAKMIADYLLAAVRPPYKLGILHDVRPSAERKVARLKKRFPDYISQDPTGPCPLEYYWRYKNEVGITTLDREIAERWIIDALLLGYVVNRRAPGGGFGCSIAHTRKRQRESLAYIAGA